MNIKELDSMFFNYLTLIFQDMSILIYRRKLDNPVFLPSYAKKEARWWQHSFSQNEKLNVKVQLDFISKEKILMNILHLLIHTYNRTVNITDMSESARGRYHKAEFAREANKIGAECQYDKNYGYELYRVNENLRGESMRIIERYYDDIEMTIKMYYGMQDMKKNASKIQRRNFVKYQCPVCKEIIMAKENTYVLCAVDGVLYERL